jgi:enamine deaminase RidA (YjgF/YER057c/UK114 family)
LLTGNRELQNVEKSIRAVDDSLLSTDIWSSVYYVTTYHVGGVEEEVTDIMSEVAKSFMGSHRPAWAAIGVESLAIGDFEISVLAAV